MSYNVSAKQNNSINKNNSNDGLTAQLLNNGQKTVGQNDQMDRINQIGEEALATGENTLQNLKVQRGQIQDGIQTNKQIKNQIDKADRTTREMRNRELYIKLALWICAILLLIADVVMLIVKLTK
ncbi:hypothetical protein PPERSA_09170 [Pseudocohnilembus persalinus]|uniref:Uncharacterized protein n=1 Tax=Pseudocohnilembus persalinus TaxID=266149 RepID=A0A0V0QXL4_PSEPJ|nr:hypothetical protein PPERSA_09170 [Pseudocohnilembus persalinus]|eukprot:KRX06768.1 hypothetical protein PPERSA_09170 [Pseudocohnilembus persalinus]